MNRKIRIDPSHQDGEFRTEPDMSDRCAEMEAALITISSTAPCESTDAFQHIAQHERMRKLAKEALGL